MKSKWLQRGAHPDLLLFWNGWGMDERPFSHLTGAAHDVLMLYDYRTLSPPDELARLDGAYGRVRQIAWSFGVWAAGAWAGTAPASVSFDLAVNGTSDPIHPLHGIPPEAFLEMAGRLSTGRRDRFYRHMFANDEDAARFMGRPPARAFAEQHEELLALTGAACLLPAPFTTALISARDRIMPARNQLRYWKTRSAVRKTNGGHFPFYLWNTWEAVLSDDG